MAQTPDTARLLHLRAEGLAKGDPVALPLISASMFHLPGMPEAGVPGYGRTDNPTREALEAALSLLEGAPALSFPSGMAAISAALFATVKSGDRLLMPSDGYYSPRLLAQEFLAGLGIAVETRPTTRFAEGGFDGFAAVFLESPSNPGLDLIDIATTAKAVRAAGGISIVDNTTMTPYGQQVLDLGADLVVASDTKAPGGHSDLLMGHVASRDDALMARVKNWRTMAGAIPGTLEAWLLYRSLETLELRFDRMCENAGVIAARLADHPKVSALRYPGLAGDPSHKLAQKQMRRMGFVIGFELVSEVAAEHFINACPLITPATSFGGVHSSAERRARWGDDVPPGFVRLSVGTEPVEGLWAAMEKALGG
ncbi:MAG: cystathionine gamma-lyase [Maritimibacter sp.]